MSFGGPRLASDARRVFVIAGGDWQVPLVRKIRRMGHSVLVSNLYADSPAFAYSDAHLVTDVRDKDANLKFARAHNVDAVVTDQSDVAVPTVSYVCEQLGLPGIGGRSAELFTNKACMRAFCRDHGFSSPSFRLCSSLDEAVSAATEFGYPCVVKPPNSQASRGVAIVRQACDLEAAYLGALRHSSNATALVEEFIAGIELTVEGFKTAARHHSLAVSRKDHYAHNPMVASRLLYGEDPEIDFTPLRAQNDAMVEAMGLPFGITHAEYKYCRGRFYLVEIAARGGGTLISSDIVPLMSGVQTNELLVRMALGENPAVEVPASNSRFAALDFWEFSPGRVGQIDGLERIRAMSDVIAAGLKLRPGDMIPAVADDTSRHGFVIVWANDRARLLQRLVEIRQSVTIAYDRNG